MGKINGKRKTILGDGSNVALFNPTRKKKGRFDNLTEIINYLNELGKKYCIQYQVLVDATLRHRIDKKDALDSAINTGKIIQCPSQTEADYFILEYYKRHDDDVIIISNDNFSDHGVSNLKQCKFAFILDEIILTPPIEQFLYELSEDKGGEKVNA